MYLTCPSNFSVLRRFVVVLSSELTGVASLEPSPAAPNSTPPVGIDPEGEPVSTSGSIALVEAPFFSEQICFTQPLFMALRTYSFHYSPSDSFSLFFLFSRCSPHFKSSTKIRRNSKNCLKTAGRFANNP